MIRRLLAVGVMAIAGLVGVGAAATPAQASTSDPILHVVVPAKNTQQGCSVKGDVFWYRDNNTAELSLYINSNNAFSRCNGLVRMEFYNAAGTLVATPQVTVGEWCGGWDPGCPHPRYNDISLGTAVPAGYVSQIDKMIVIVS